MKKVLNNGKENLKITKMSFIKIFLKINFQKALNNSTYKRLYKNKRLN